MVVFCVDISKGPRRKTQEARHKGQDFDLWAEEVGLWSLVWSLGAPALIPVVTKCDLLSEEVLSDRLAELNKLFGVELLVTSAKTGTGIELLRETVDKKIIEMAFGPAAAQPSALPFSPVWQTPVALTARHRQCAGEAIANISESINELQAGNDEVTAMMLRAAYQGICDIESATGGAGQVDEQILEKIFARFCIGK